MPCLRPVLPYRSPEAVASGGAVRPGREILAEYGDADLPVHGGLRGVRHRRSGNSMTTSTTMHLESGVVFGDRRLPVRFWSKVSVQPNGCWLWRAGKNGKGYGYFYFNGRNQKAHRVAYELLTSPFTGTLQSDHLCRNPSCVNPVHIEPVTRKENILRSGAPSAINATKTHCPQGHPYDEGNTYRYQTRSGRACLTCKRIAGREYQQRRRERGL